jgi:translation initiation factor IF-2
MDRPDANADKVRNDMLQHELVSEELGGDILAVEVSAKEKTNLDKLAETILLQAEILELKANPERSSEGIVLEARVDRGRGIVASLLVQRGTLSVGDIVVAGSQWGRIRAMIDDRGANSLKAIPATPIEVLGLTGVPEAGDEFVVVENEKRAREVSEFRTTQDRNARSGLVATPLSIEQMFADTGEEKLQEMPLVVKADVHGSAEAIVGAMGNISTEEVAVQVLHSGVGGITESDVTLAKASRAGIIGFNVRANTQAKELANREGIEIRYYSVIYDAVDDVKAKLEGMLKPDLREKFLGNALVLQVFNVGKTGRVAGCRVTDGLVRRGAKVRLLRDDIVIHDGALKTLRRFKEEAKEVKEGYECGMAFENYDDLREGDTLEFYEIEEVARKLDK